jgi:hypothetical protein
MLLLLRNVGMRTRRVCECVFSDVLYVSYSINVSNSGGCSTIEYLLAVADSLCNRYICTYTYIHIYVYVGST